jgi:hypothetical protein
MLRHHSITLGSVEWLFWVKKCQNRAHAPSKRWRHSVTSPDWAKDLRLSVRHSVRRWRLSGAETWNVPIGNGQRGECGSVVYCKLRKNVVQVNFDGS